MSLLETQSENEVRMLQHIYDGQGVISVSDHRSMCAVDGMDSEEYAKSIVRLISNGLVSLVLTDFQLTPAGLGVLGLK